MNTFNHKSLIELLEGKEGEQEEDEDEDNENRAAHRLDFSKITLREERSNLFKVKMIMGRP